MTAKDARRISQETDELRKTLSDRSAAQHQLWLSERWWPEVKAAHGKISVNRVWFLVVRIGQVSGAAALPVFATAGTLTSGHVWGWITVAVSLLIAVLMAFDHVYRPGVRWRAAYKSFYELIDAAWLYLETPDLADKPGSAFDSFVISVEKTIVNERVEYLRDIANLNTAAGVDGDSVARVSPREVQGANA